MTNFLKVMISKRRNPKNQGDEMEITAIARDLQNLESQIGRLRIACGNSGSMIAKNAIQNSGKADVSMKILLLATADDDGACAIFDNFLLIDTKTQRPLIHALLNHYKNNK